MTFVDLEFTKAMRIDFLDAIDQVQHRLHDISPDVPHAASMVRDFTKEISHLQVSHTWVAAAERVLGRLGANGPKGMRACTRRVAGLRDVVRACRALGWPIDLRRHCARDPRQGSRGSRSSRRELACPHALSDPARRLGHLDHRIRGGPGDGRGLARGHRARARRALVRMEVVAHFWHPRGTARGESCIFVAFVLSHPFRQGRGGLALHHHRGARSRGAGVLDRGSRRQAT
jgi:hypothetical protein